MDEKIKRIYDGILNGEHTEMGIRVQAALDSGLTAKSILEEGMIPAMREVGSLFENGEFYVPEMLVSARAMQAGLAVLKPLLKEANVISAGRVAIATVKGDLHDIGKNLVAMMLEGAGFDIVDLGADAGPEKFIAIADSVDVIALSALLTTTMPMMRSIIQGLETAGKRSQVKVIIGGAPVTEAFAREINADGYAPDASRAVALTQSLLERKGK
jgi:5-methyltetrahydrofolate--homocysteine methyltransferase